VTAKRLSAAVLAITALGIVFVAGPRSTSAKAPPPPKRTPGKQGPAQQPDRATIAAGQKLFFARCAKCHAAPKLSKYSTEQWPRIVQKMAKRSGLKPDQQQAVLAYILATRPK
jgi:cytochrome c5